MTGMPETSGRWEKFLHNYKNKTIGRLGERKGVRNDFLIANPCNRSNSWSKILLLWLQAVLRLVVVPPFLFSDGSVGVRLGAAGSQDDD